MVVEARGCRHDAVGRREDGGVDGTGGAGPDGRYTYGTSAPSYDQEREQLRSINCLNWSRSLERAEHAVLFGRYLLKQCELKLR